MRIPNLQNVRHTTITRTQTQSRRETDLTFKHHKQKTILIKTTRIAEIISSPKLILEQTRIVDKSCREDIVVPCQQYRTG